MSAEGNISGSNEGQNVQPRNLLQGRWSVQLTTPKVSSDNDKITIEPEILKVTRRFNGGMVYEVKGQKFILGEYIIGGVPFLVVFRIEQEKKRGSLDEIAGFPDGVRLNTLKASAQIVQNIKIPSNMSEVQVDMTEHMSKQIDLPEDYKDWKLIKAIMRVGIADKISTTSCTICDNPPCDCFGTSLIRGESILL